jgi:hypothetical protein
MDSRLFYAVVVGGLLTIAAVDAWQLREARREAERAMRDAVSVCVVTRDDEPVHDADGRAKIEADCQRREAAYQAEYGAPSGEYVVPPHG